MKSSILTALLFNLFIAVNLQATAQGMAIEGETFFVSENTQVIISTPLTNNGNIINRGNLYIEKDWINNQVFSDTSGTVTLYGLQSQTIQSSGLQFYNLDVNGSGEKTFIGNGIIDNELHLQEGLLSPAIGSYIYVQTPAVINGGSSSSYINGLLYREGNDELSYPIGKNGNYAPVTISTIRGINPVIGFEVFEPLSNPVPGDGLSSVSNVRYWQKSVLSGSFEDAMVTLSVVGDEDFGDLFYLAVSETDDLNYPFSSLSQSYHSGDNYIGTVTSLRPFRNNYLALAFVSDKGLIEKIYIPNAFSPKAPSFDDRAARIYSTMVSDNDFSFKIYNRKGMLVFETDSYQFMQDQGWNGQNNRTGKTEPMGVYDYILTGKLINERFFKKSGTITIIN